MGVKGPWPRFGLPHRDTSESPRLVPSEVVWYKIFGFEIVLNVVDQLKGLVELQLLFSVDRI